MVGDVFSGSSSGVCVTRCYETTCLGAVTAQLTNAQVTPTNAIQV